MLMPMTRSEYPTTGKHVMLHESPLGHVLLIGGGFGGVRKAVNDWAAH